MAFELNTALPLHLRKALDRLASDIQMLSAHFSQVQSTHNQSRSSPSEKAHQHRGRQSARSTAWKLRQPEFQKHPAAPIHSKHPNLPSSRPQPVRSRQASPIRSRPAVQYQDAQPPLLERLRSQARAVRSRKAAPIQSRPVPSIPNEDVPLPRSRAPRFSDRSRQASPVRSYPALPVLYQDPSQYSVYAPPIMRHPEFEQEYQRQWSRPYPMYELQAHPYEYHRPDPGPHNSDSSYHNHQTHYTHNHTAYPDYQHHQSPSAFPDQPFNYDHNPEYFPTDEVHLPDEGENYEQVREEGEDGIEDNGDHDGNEYNEDREDGIEDDEDHEVVEAQENDEHHEFGEYQEDEEYQEEDDGYWDGDDPGVSYEEEYYHD